MVKCFVLYGVCECLPGGLAQERVVVVIEEDDSDLGVEGIILNSDGRITGE